MASPVGTLAEPLAFRFFDTGPEGVVGDACRDKFRGVVDTEVPCELVVFGIGGWNEVGALCCFILWRSEVDCVCRTGAGESSVVSSAINSAGGGAAGLTGQLAVEGCVGALVGRCVLWSSVIMIEEDISWTTTLSW